MAGRKAGRARGATITQLLFFDVDGTIFDDRRRLPASVLPALEAARRGGCRLLVNTGRTLCNQDRRLDGFPLDGWIMGCGTRVVYRGETLRSMEHSPEETLRLREVFLELGIPTVWECDTAMYFDPLGAPHPRIAGFRAFSEAAGILREVAAGDPEFRAVKMFCFADEDAIAGMERRTRAAGMPYEAIRRRPGEWEVVPSGYSKGKGIDFLREYLGAAREDCYAFGDSTNDLTMFAHAGHSIAMGNAAAEVRAACTYVTDLPERDGIRNALLHYHLI